MLRKEGPSPGEGLREAGKALSHERSADCCGTAVEPVRSEVRLDAGAVDRAVAAFQAGRRAEESFRFLFETYYRRVKGFFFRRTGSAEDSLDLTQETFLRVYKGLEGFRGDAPFGAWLFRIATNVYRQHLARQGSGGGAHEVALDVEAAAATEAPGEGDAARPVEEPVVFESVLDSERREILRQAIEKLPTQRRRCIILWAYHDLTYEQIAVAMRLSTGTVKAHLAQARQQLERFAAQ